MRSQILPALRIMIFMTVVLGIAYPLAVTGLCQLFFPRQANGSLVQAGGNTVGSELIAQKFTRPEYFQPRPSAASENGYDAANSGASNYGPANPKLAARVEASIGKFRNENPAYSGPIPADLVTASGSGLDPHLSPDSAGVQAARVSHERGIDLDEVRRMMDRFTAPPTWGVVGEPRVNVLLLNLALDREYPRR